jgi:hypothetical protein
VLGKANPENPKNPEEQRTLNRWIGIFQDEEEDPVRRIYFLPLARRSSQVASKTARWMDGWMDGWMDLM